MPPPGCPRRVLMDAREFSLTRQTLGQNRLRHNGDGDDEDDGDDGYVGDFSRSKRSIQKKK
eukprot:7019187-Lingulodinium_polyedra.AAC.1